MLPRTCFSPAAIRRRLGGRSLPAEPAKPPVHQWRWLTESRDVEFALPGLVSRQPPMANAGLARTIVRVDHSPVLERPLIVAPATLAITRRPKVPARSATTRDTGPETLGLGRHALDLASRFPGFPIGIVDDLVSFVDEHLGVTIVVLRDGSANSSSSGHRSAPGRRTPGRDRNSRTCRHHRFARRPESRRVEFRPAQLSRRSRYRPWRFRQRPLGVDLRHSVEFLFFAGVGKLEHRTRQATIGWVLGISRLGGMYWFEMTSGSLSVLVGWETEYPLFCCRSRKFALAFARVRDPDWR